MSGVLTAAAVERLKPDPAKRLEVPDAALPTFYLVIQPSGAKSWAVRFRIGGRPKKLTLAPYPAVSLRDAREMARAALTKVAQGDDPAAEKIARRRQGGDGQPDRDLFEVAALEFIERHAKRHTREASWREAQRVLQGDAARAWRGRRVQTIDRRAIIAFLDPIIDRGSPVAANRSLAVVRKFFAWLIERGALEANPCSSIRAPSPTRARDRILSDAELKLAWRAASELGHPFAGLIKLLVLTGARLREVGETTDGEIDLASRTWTLPRRA